MRLRYHNALKRAEVHRFPENISIELVNEGIIEWEGVNKSIELKVSLGTK